MSDRNREVIRCGICPKACRIPPGFSGECRVRMNLDGRLVAVTYARPCAVHVDPMEKKPLFHFFPGEMILSLGSAGCNLHCKHCQNADLRKAIRGYHAFDLRRGTPTLAKNMAAPMWHIPTMNR